MARKKRSKRRRKHKTKLPILPSIPVVWKAIVEPLLGAPGLSSGALAFFQQGKPDVALKEYLGMLGYNFLGVNFHNGVTDYMRPIQTYGMILLGAAGSKIASKAGANRIMAKIPYIGDKIKL